MIICICNKLSEKKLKQACENICSSPCAEKVMNKLGCKPICGQCVCYIEDVLMSKITNNPNNESVVN